MDATGEQARVCAALNRWAHARGQAHGVDDPELLAARAELVHLLEDAGRPPVPVEDERQRG